ncbi:MAG: hypothetical protein BIFFINMI_03508 [Phycisphaerae bacterium]|nr:hypothetical protein [Phycisphaerae bacterium]
MVRKLLLLLALLISFLGGCVSPPADTHLQSPYPRMRVVAIAPFMNQSGSPYVDPLAVSDIFFSELQMVQGFQVLPVNRTLQAMAALRMQAVSGPDDLLKLAEFLGADMVFAGAVTAYNPYDPPEVGLAVQLYSLRGRDAAGQGGLTPTALERSGRPFPVDPDLSGADPRRPASQLNEIYNAAHEIVQKEVREYAEIRGAADSPYRWQLYTKSISHFMRFCCHEAVRDLLRQEYYRQALADQAREAQAVQTPQASDQAYGSRP